MKNSLTNLLFALAVTLVSAIPAFSLDGTEILKKVDANLQPESFESYRKLINIEPSGAKREFLLYTLKKGNDKIVSLFISPASEKGRATLRLGENMWLYIPNVGKPVDPRRQPAPVRRQLRKRAGNDDALGHLLEVEDLVELRPGPDATTTYPFVTLEWARQWPSEEVWKVRKKD